MIQTSKLLLDLKGYTSILTNWIHLESIANNPRILKDRFEFFITHIHDCLDIPLMEMLAIILTLSENCNPRESGLSSLECEKFE